MHKGAKTILRLPLEKFFPGGQAKNSRIWLPGEPACDSWFQNKTWTWIYAGCISWLLKSAHPKVKFSCTANPLWVSQTGSLSWEVGWKRKWKEVSWWSEKEKVSPSFVPDNSDPERLSHGLQGMNEIVCKIDVVFPQAQISPYKG